MYVCVCVCVYACMYVGMYVLYDLKKHGDHGNHSIQVILFLSLSLQQSGAMQQEL